MDDASLSGTIVSIVAGALCAFAIGALSALIARRQRVRGFVRDKEPKRRLPRWFPEIAAPERCPDDRQRDNAMWHTLALVHGEAKALQDQSIALLIATSTTLLGAFVFTALSVTLWRDAPPVHIMSAAFDVAALAYCFFAFRRSGRYRTAWLRRRAIAELLRQWLTVDYLLAPRESALTAHVEGLLAGWEKAVTKAPATLIESVAEQAHARIDALTAKLGDSQVSEAALRAYYVARPQRQTRWFATTLERLERGHHGRKSFMKATFFGAAIAACVKFAALLFHNEDLSQVALLAVLICIGLAGASSSAYLGQNRRSLKHRYLQQLRAIEGWVQQSKQDGVVVHLQGGGIVSSAAIIRDIRAFEELMAIELLDWMAISTDDAMELAPS